MKVRVPARAGLARFFLAPVGRILILSSAVLVVFAVALFCYSYQKYTGLVEQKLRGPSGNTAKIFAAPESIAVGDASSPDDIAAHLRRSGYTESHSNPQGYFQRHPGSIDIFPGPESYFDQEAATLKFANGHISEIVSLQDNTTRPEYQLEPQLITNVAGPSREKRRTVKFRDIPTVLVQAITSAEDKHFFEHLGEIDDGVDSPKARHNVVERLRDSVGVAEIGNHSGRPFQAVDSGGRRCLRTRNHRDPRTFIVQES